MSNPNITAYYSFNRILSHNAIYNFIVGARGLGKTYGAKKKVIKDFLKKEHEFIYARRYKEDLKSRFSFFADIAHEFPDWDFRVNGLDAECAPIKTREDKKRSWRKMGSFVALSQSQSYKSVAYPNVRTIIFDEFIIEKGAVRYLPNEARVFNDLYSTVDRYKDKTRVLFLANSITITNPYFLELRIRPDERPGELLISHDGFVAAHFPDAKDFQNEVYKTRFGRFIADSDYADYAVGSQFRDNTDNLLKPKPSDAKYYMSLETPQGQFSIWTDKFYHNYFFQEKQPVLPVWFTLIPEKMDEDKTLLLYNDKMLQWFRAAFNQGRAYFDTPQTRNAFIEIFKR